MKKVLSLKRVSYERYKKVKGMKTVFEARQNNVRSYFTKDPKTSILQIIAQCPKTDQDASLELLDQDFDSDNKKL